MKNIFLFILTLLSFSSFITGNELSISAVRQPHQSWTSALGIPFTVSDNSVLSAMRSIGDDKKLESRQTDPDVEPDLGGIPEWKGTLEELTELQTLARSVRPYENPNAGHYKRQAPWLYPIDGCYAKAAHVSAVAQKQGFVAPGKVFAFGNLVFATEFAKAGRVFWSYHVVAAYHLDKEIYVIDPVVSRNPAGTNTGLMRLSTWVSRISKNPEDVQISLCDANSYSPRSRCIGGKNSGAYLGHMREILKDEYENLVYIGFTPDDLLAPSEEPIN